VPGLLTLIEVVVSPVLQTNVYGAVPAEADAVSTTLLPEQIAGPDEDMLTLSVH
jgi:hypothetical protein